MGQKLTKPRRPAFQGGRGLNNRWLAHLAARRLAALEAARRPADPALLAEWVRSQTRDAVLRVRDEAMGLLRGDVEAARLFGEYLLNGVALALHALNGGGVDPLAAAKVAVGVIVEKGG